jgi:NADH:ubiquinone oxidoreductase subunit 6 (subunit J)
MILFAQNAVSPANTFSQFLARDGLAYVPLALGALAVFLLLPRPRVFPRVYGIVTAAAAILTTGLLLLRPMGFSAEVGLFYAFAALALAGGGLLITQENPARAALSFVLVVLSTSGLFLLLAAPFLFAATIIVYAGAIIVTFLFVLMLAQQYGYSDADSRSREPALATLTGALLLGVILYVVRLGHNGGDFQDVLDGIAAARQAETGEAMRDAVQSTRSDRPDETVTLFSTAAERLAALGFNQASARATDLDFNWNALDPDRPDQLPLAKAREQLDRLEAVIETRLRSGLSAAVGVKYASGMSGVPGGTPWSEIRRDPNTRIPHLPAENTAYLGRAVFTDFLLPVEITGLLLLMATVGAIVISQRRDAVLPVSEENNANQTRTQRGAE